MSIIIRSWFTWTSSMTSTIFRYLSFRTLFYCCSPSCTEITWTFIIWERNFQISFRWIRIFFNNKFNTCTTSTRIILIDRFYSIILRNYRNFTRINSIIIFIWRICIFCSWYMYILYIPIICNRITCIFQTIRILIIYMISWSTPPLTISQCICTWLILPLFSF